MRSIKLEWNGEDFCIRPDQAFAAAEVVEQFVTLTDLPKLGEHLPLTKLARCFAALVEFAGGHADAADVHKFMLAEMKAVENDAGKADAMLAVKVIHDLVEVLMDGAPEMDAADGDGSGKGKAS